MIWAGRYYDSEPLIGPYLRRFDLSAGWERWNSITGSVRGTRR